MGGQPKGEEWIGSTARFRSPGPMAETPNQLAAQSEQHGTGDDADGGIALPVH